MSLLSTWGMTDHKQVADKAMLICGYNNAVTDITHPNRRRKQAIAQRLRLYRGAASVDFALMIDQLFLDQTVKRQRKQLIPYASYQNISKRIVDEVASLYNAPALRRMASTADTTAYRAMVRDAKLDRVAQHAQRMLMLCNDVLLWNTKLDNGKIGLRVITSDMLSAIASDEGELAAIVIDRAPESSGERTLITGSEKIVYDLWDDTYHYALGMDGRIMELVEHHLGRIPGVLMHAYEPNGAELLTADMGSDITSAHFATFFYNMMTLRLGKSQGERQPYISGDAPGMATDQTMDGERPLVLNPGVIVGMLDSKTAPEHYLMAKRDVLTSVGQTYGLSYEQITYTAETSGTSIDARREKLRELRNEQRLRAIDHEQQICELFGFDASQLTVDFSEQTMPLDEAAAVTLLREKCSLGLDSPVAYLMRKDPDINEVTAMETVRKNVADWAISVELVRALNMPHDGSVGETPTENGQNNFAPPGAQVSTGREPASS